MKSVLILLAVLLLAGPVSAQDYVGDTTCGGCHANFPEMGFFDGYMRSGHPWKIFRTEGLDPAVDTWPHTPVPPLPMVNSTQLLWSDVEYVIGNYYWKTRFIDRRGFIWTGSATDSTQWNVLTEEWAQYHPGEVDKPFDCGKCHTTGYDPAGNQHGLSGLVGTWAQDGVRCEACHGPGSDHVANTSTPPPGGKDCADCHFRDAQFRMPWKGGFMRHHQQSEDLSHSPHDIYACSTCHNPHRSVVYDDGGTITECSDCHPGTADNNFYTVDRMESLECIDCHMPFMGKSGQSFGPYTGDIRGHLFRIMTDPIAAADNVYDDGTGNLFWNQDLNGDSYVTLDYACIGCHTEWSLEQAATAADSIHTKTFVPVKLASFEISRQAGGAVLEWDVSEAYDHSGFHVYRQVLGESRTKISESLLSGKSSYTFVDENAPTGEADYWLAELSRAGTTTWHGPVRLQAATIGTPSVALAPVWPNPFAQAATINYVLANAGPVQLVVYDANGREVRTLVDRVEDPGAYAVSWDGRTDSGAGVASGIYMITLRTGDVVRIQKAVYTR